MRPKHIAIVETQLHFNHKARTIIIDFFDADTCTEKWRVQVEQLKESAGFFRSHALGMKNERMKNEKIAVCFQGMFLERS